GAIAQVVAGPLGFLFLPEVGEVSDQNGTLATPAGYAFAIWGPIFLLLAVYAVYQALPAQRENRLLRRIGWWIAAACLGNALWTVVFPQRQFVLAQVIIVAIFACLAVAFGLLARETRARDLSGAERWLVALPLGLLFGWLSAATLAGFAVTLRAIDLLPRGTGEVIFAAALIFLCGGVASLVLLRGAVVPAQGLLAYATAVVWALIAIVAAGGAASTPIAVVAVAMIVAVIVAALGALFGGGAARGVRRQTAIGAA
ncbi:MAG TPA: hypothetical protein VIL85_18760, partial [Thermomicrobiales bacterium]